MSGPHRSVSVGANSTTSSHTTSPTYGLNTCRTTRSNTTQETIEAMPNKVKDSATGKTFLELKLLCHVGQTYTLSHLISVLFQVTQMSSTMPIHVTLAICAVAFIMKEHIASKIAELAAKPITDNLTAKLVDHMVAAISLQVASIHNTSQTLNATIKGSAKLHTSIGRERTEKEDNVKTAADRIEEAADALYDSVETY